MSVKILNLRRGSQEMCHAPHTCPAPSNREAVIADGCVALTQRMQLFAEGPEELQLISVSQAGNYEVPCDSKAGRKPRLHTCCTHAA